MTNPATRTREDPEARRAQIIGHAVTLIGERGYYGFTVQALARRCGLSNPGLLHYFPSKHAVLLAVLQELEADATEVMTPLVRTATHEPRSASAKDAVFLVLRTIVARASDRPDICRLLAELQSESLDPAHPGYAWWRRREAAVLGLFTTLLDPFVDKPLPVARQLLAMMDGLFIQWLRADRSFDVVAALDHGFARLLPELQDRNTAASA